MHTLSGSLQQTPLNATGPPLYITVPTHGTRASTIAVTSSSSVEPAVATTTKGSNDVQILVPLLAGAACAVVLLTFFGYRLKKRNEGSYELQETLILNSGGFTKEKEVFV